MTTRLNRLVCWTIGALVCASSIVACGKAAHQAAVTRVQKQTIDVPKVGLWQSPEEVQGIPVLAKGVVPGGGKFAIFLEPSEADNGKSIEYSLMIGKAMPVKYEPFHPPPSHVRDGMLWGKAGGRMVVGEDSDAAVIMTIIDGCTGPYPHRVAWGLLKARRDTVTAYTDHRSIRFRTAALPRQLRVAGVAVYASLPPRSGGKIVTRTANGRVVNEESLPRPSEAGKCGGR